MPLSEDNLRTLLSHMTEQERTRGVLYVAEDVVRRGTRLEFPGVSIDFPEDAHLAFLDQAPLANWGHPCRYLVLFCGLDRLEWVPARFPPFGAEDALGWKLAYKGHSVPDWAVMESGKHRSSNQK